MTQSPIQQQTIQLVATQIQKLKTQGRNANAICAR